MARRKRVKKKFKRFIFAFIVVILFVGGAFCYLNFFSQDKPKAKKVDVVSKIKGYGYELKDNKNEKYKKLFYKLKEILEEDKVDEEKYVKTISKMFVIDFYSLSDKIAKTDVGGSDFVHSLALADFLENAQDTMYKYVESDLYGNRKQKLPTVDEVEIESVEKEAFTYGEEVDSEAYVVKLKWTYTDEYGEGYQDSCTLTFVHEDKKLSLVELQ